MEVAKTRSSFPTNSDIGQQSSGVIFCTGKWSGWKGLYWIWKTVEGRFRRVMASLHEVWVLGGGGGARKRTTDEEEGEEAAGPGEAEPAQGADCAVVME